MDGAKRKRRPPLEVRREFVGYRLEKQILARVYELAVPLLRENAVFVGDSPSTELWTAERERLRPLAKGA